MDPVLPGEDLIDEGVSDLRAERETIAALLVAIGSRGFAYWESNFLIVCRKTPNIASMNYWRKTSLILRTRATML